LPQSASPPNSPPTHIERPVASSPQNDALRQMLTTPTEAGKPALVEHCQRRFRWSPQHTRHRGSRRLDLPSSGSARANTKLLRACFGRGPRSILVGCRTDTGNPLRSQPFIRSAKRAADAIDPRLANQCYCHFSRPCTDCNLLRRQ